MSRVLRIAVLKDELRMAADLRAATKKNMPIVGKANAYAKAKSEVNDVQYVQVLNMSDQAKVNAHDIAKDIANGRKYRILK